MLIAVFFPGKGAVLILLSQTDIFYICIDKIYTMNFQQLEYIVAVDTHRNFVKAAEACFVTQATLSMMIKKIEEELEVRIFDRSRQPVKPTEAGQKIILQARKILSEASKLKAIVYEEKAELKGELKIGIIPTLAPYLLPLFLKEFIQAYPEVKLVINEYTTDVVMHKLKTAELDAGILATPLQDASLDEQPLFYEKYYLYVNGKEKGFDKQYVLPKSIDINRLWLLEEGHCMRSQILNFCELKKKHRSEEMLNYSSGSIETLKNMVDKNFGITIIPELATLNFSKPQRKQLRYFKSPQPVREISLVAHRSYIKVHLLEAFKTVLLAAIPDEMKKHQKMNVIPVH